MSAKTAQNVLNDQAALAAAGDYKVADIGLAQWGRREMEIAEKEMPGLMATREKIRRGQAPVRGAHLRLPAHDHPDRRSHRDPGGLGSPGALGLMQHLLHPGPRRRSHSRDRRAGFRLEGRDPGGVLVVHQAGAYFPWRQGAQPGGG